MHIYTITREWLGEDDAVIGCVELRVIYTYRRGSPAVMYLRNGDPGYPEESPEIEIVRVEQESLTSGKSIWLPASEDNAEWAIEYFEARTDEVLAEAEESRRADYADAMEARAEARRDYP
tara:strand:+ start:789 stop:1148 length:360 start_codon:yes stop_codon:yes gene_type:complete